MSDVNDHAPQDAVKANSAADNPIEGLGAARTRGDGKVKVTGEAHYAVEHQPENPL